MYKQVKIMDEESIDENYINEDTSDGDNSPINQGTNDNDFTKESEPRIQTSLLLIKSVLWASWIFHHQ